ncbi:hypothetical protein [Tahibacter sp.]|uniref:hypothetical protein n=1 Tax=Tahibacter sp. TaxID=2056211 RepID=UPI0028C409DC|nr:hypothetical protein [Tahibacter sp.]
MRQFRINRTNALMLGLVMAGACGVSYGADVPLVFENEDVATFSAMQINKTPSELSTTTTLRMLRPTLCGRVNSAAPPTGFANRINPTFAGHYAGGDFKFGFVNGGNQMSISGIGFWNYRPNGLTIQADAETLCYVLTADGVRKASSGLFTDNFDAGNLPDASITTSVAMLPSFGNSYTYTYYIDVRIPAEFASVRYAVRDGFDSSVFATGSARYCPAAPIGTTECLPGALLSNSVDITSTVPPGGLAVRYVVLRQLNVGAALPADTSIPVTYAALFLPDGAENNLSNNVSSGRNALSDLAPVITAASNMVPNLAEGTGATGLSFVITDDTNETGLPALNASVAIDFDGTLVNATNVSCAQIDPPQSGEAVRRTCRFDIPVFDADFATDASTPGVYAPGVHASVIITATDSRSQTSTTAVPFHVVSSDNDAAIFSLTSLAVPDATEGKVPTITCSLSRPTSAQCIGVLPDFVTGLLPGPVNAADEIATQGAVLGAFPGNKLNCTWTSPSIFSFNGLNSPAYVYNGARIDLDYRLSGNLGSADCWVSAVDYGYPSNQTAGSTNKLFRIVVVD